MWSKVDLAKFNSYSTTEKFNVVASRFTHDQGLQKYISQFMQYTGQYGRLRDGSNSLMSNGDCYAIEQNAFLSTTATEAANIAFSQLWSNDNESIVLENLNDDQKYDNFITYLNKTSLSAIINLVIRDYINFGFAFVYVEEITTFPYVHFKILNPLSIAWLEYNEAYFYHSKYYNKNTKSIEYYVDVITQDESYRLFHDGKKSKTDLKYSSIIAIKPDSMNDINGIGLNILSAMEDLTSAINGYRYHMAMHIKPPIIENAHSIVEDNEIDRRPDGVTRLAEQYSEGSAMNPTALVLDKYHNVLNDMQQYIQMQRSDIQKAYRIDLLESQAKDSAFQLLRTHLYYIFVPKLLDVVIDIYKRKMKVDLGKDYILKFDTLANNASTASKANNMTEFLNMVGMVEKIAGAAGLKLNPSKIVEEIGNILKINPFVLLSEEEMTQLLQDIADKKKQNQQQPQPLQGQ